MITLIKKALETDGVKPFFQPIYNFHTDKIEKFECLMRIIDEKDEVVLPFKFLDIAKKTKLYPKLTNKMIEKSAIFFKDTSYEFSINLTVEDLLNDDTMEFLLHTIKDNEIEDKIVLEIVESEHIDNYDEAIRILDRFKSIGVRIAIDDFGSGYSNFDYLIRLKADYVKIDGSIIKQIESDESAKELVLSIVRFAKKSNMKIIAEFVSSEKIANILRDIGVDYAQGFYYGKPEQTL
jgi:EAL domain-containing protein (putative c-di-GMP-specific phosphodiesterase class I)